MGFSWRLRFWLFGRRASTSFPASRRWFRITIEFRIVEQLRNIAEVQNFKMPFAFIFAYTSSSTDYLLKLSHGLYFFINDNQATGLAIHSGWEHLRSGYNGRIWLVNIDEIIQLSLPFVVISGDFHHITMILPAKIRIEICEQLTHSLCLINIWTEYNGLRHSPDLLEHLCNSPRNNFSSFPDGQFSSEVFPTEVIRLNDFTIQILFTLFRNISCKVNTQEGISHTIRCQESIFNTLLQRIWIYWLPKIIEIICAIHCLWSCGHTYLCGWREIFQDFFPLRVILGRSPVTLINYNQVKERRLELCIRVWLIFIRRYKLLIKCHIDLVRWVHISVLDFGHLALERTKILSHCLVNENIPICKIKNLLHSAGLGKPMDYLERSKCLSCSGGHHQQDSLLPFCNSLDSSVNCYALIITWLVRIGIKILRSLNYFLCFRPKQIKTLS